MSSLTEQLFLSRNYGADQKQVFTGRSQGENKTRKEIDERIAFLVSFIIAGIANGGGGGRAFPARPMVAN